MTTNTYNTPIAHTNDADFRAWYQALETALIAVGLSLTADTGQVNTATMVRPATNAYAGYRILQFNDTLQATAPIIIKLEPGTGSVATYPSLRISVGVATDGAGTLTGTLKTATMLCLKSTAALISTVNNYPTYVCGIEGYTGVGFKLEAQASSGLGGFHICRSCDSSGAPTADGVTLYGAVGGNVVAQCLSFSANTVYAAANTNYCLVPMSMTSSVVGLDVQAYKHYAPAPRVRCNPFLLTIHAGDVTIGTNFTQTPIGATSHNYLSLGTGGGASAGAGGGSNFGLAMVYE